MFIHYITWLKKRFSIRWKIFLPTWTCLSLPCCCWCLDKLMFIIGLCLVLLPYLIFYRILVLKKQQLQLFKLAKLVMNRIKTWVSSLDFRVKCRNTKLNEVFAQPNTFWYYCINMLLSFVYVPGKECPDSLYTHAYRMRWCRSHVWYHQHFDTRRNTVTAGIYTIRRKNVLYPMAPLTIWVLFQSGYHNQFVTNCIKAKWYCIMAPRLSASVGYMFWTGRVGAFIPGAVFHRFIITPSSKPIIQVALFMQCIMNRILEWWVDCRKLWSPHNFFLLGCLAISAFRSAGSFFKDFKDIAKLMHRT